MLACGCFSEPEPIDDDSGTPMCVQAPCTTSDDTSTGATAPSTSDVTSSVPESTTGEADSTTAASDDDDPDTTGPVATCGDGEINQPSEMCDSTPGCRPDCTFESYECNPLNDAGCVSGLRCGAIDVPAQTFGCMPPGAGALGELCGAAATNDGDCGVGLTCLRNASTPLCDENNCCVEYCDLTDPSFRCSGGATCRQFFIDSMFVGLEHLGYCGDA